MFAEYGYVESKKSTNRRDYSTIEVGRVGSQDGQCLTIEGVASNERLQRVLLSAFRIAGHCEHRIRRVTHPGWWLGVVFCAALEHGLRVSIQRGRPVRAYHHAVLVVSEGAMVGEFPDWPVCRFAGRKAWHDLRNEEALSHGCSDSDLERYALGMMIDTTEGVGFLRRMFDEGVLVWGDVDERIGRRRVVAMGLDGSRG